MSEPQGLLGLGEVFLITIICSENHLDVIDEEIYICSASKRVLQLVQALADSAYYQSYGVI